MKSLLAPMAALAVVAGLVTATPALADPPIGSRIDRSDGGLTGRHNSRNATSPRPGIHAYFRCLASLDRGRAREIVDLAYMSDEQQSLIETVGPRSGWSDDRREDCFSNFGGGGVSMKFDPVSPIGAFAEFLATREFEIEDAERIASLTREDWKAPALTPRNGSEMIGLCTAQAAGPQVFRLIETEPASVEESAAMQTIVPFLGPCLTEGVEVSFDASSLRALLAHSLFKALTGMEALGKAQS